MEENQAGVTALVTAYARAYHATHDSPKIFDDFLADQLFSPEEQTYLNKNLAGILPMIDAELAESVHDQETAVGLVMQLQNGPITLSRSRFVEDYLDVAIHNGVEQYVILGAGFDTFAFRRLDLVNKIKVFEVDHPNTQSLKSQRILTAGWTIPSNLELIPIDFNRENLVERFKGSSYNPHKKTTFSWLGVTYYLTQQVILDTLRMVAQLSPKGSQLVFDYLHIDAFDPQKADKRTQLTMSITRQTGEPMKTGIDPKALGDILAKVGYSLKINLAPDEIQNLYFKDRQDRYRASKNIYLARAEVF